MREVKFNLPLDGRRRLTISVTEVIKAPEEDRWWKIRSESWQNEVESSGGLVRHPRIGI